MLSGKDVVLVYETVLCSPGMLDTLKINLQLSRKTVLLLSKVIEQGLSMKPDTSQPGLLQVLQEPDITALKQVAEELLQKGGLIAMNDNLLALQSK